MGVFLGSFFALRRPGLIRAFGLTSLLEGLERLLFDPFESSNEFVGVLWFWSELFLRACFSSLPVLIGVVMTSLRPCCVHCELLMLELTIPMVVDLTDVSRNSFDLLP